MNEYYAYEVLVFDCAEKMIIKNDFDTKLTADNFYEVVIGNPIAEKAQLIRTTNEVKREVVREYEYNYAR